MRKKMKAKSKSMNPKNAEFLKDAPPEKAFWVSNGWIIRNMEEIPAALENMSDETFVSHVNKDKNDFAAWVKEVLGDKSLAATLRLVRNRRSAIEVVKRRLKQLK